MNIQNQNKVVNAGCNYSYYSEQVDRIMTKFKYIT